jgi:hypothetical protein
MKVKYIYIAIILVTLPAIYFLNPANLTNFKWYYLLIFWPVLVIIWGIHMLPFKEHFRLIMIVGCMLITGFFIYLKLLQEPKYFSRTFNEMMQNKYIVKFREDLPYREEIVDPGQLEKYEKEADSIRQQPEDSLPQE